MTSWVSMSTSSRLGSVSGSAPAWTRSIRQSRAPSGPGRRAGEVQVYTVATGSNSSRASSVAIQRPRTACPTAMMRIPA